MNKITNGYWEFEIVDHVPPGYDIWNIGKNMIDGYLPLCRLSKNQPFPGGRNIETDTLKAIKTEHAQTILAAVIIGPSTIKEMETYITKHPNEWGVDQMKAALPHMRELKGF